MRVSRNGHVCLDGAVAVIIGVALLLPLGACEGSITARPPDTRSVVLGVSREPLSAFAYIARDEGLFEQAGLDVEFVEYESAQQAMDALLAGEVEAALAADTPIVSAAINGEPLRIITTVGTDANDIKVVARSDAGISAPADLRGKRVGTRKLTAAHFFLHVFLVKYGIRDADVDVRYDSFENVTAALVAGDLDAVAVREPFITQLRNALGDRFLLFEEEGLYGKTMNLCVLADDQGPDAEVQRRLIRACIAAEEVALADSTGRVRQEVADAVGVPQESMCECVIVDGAIGLRQSLVLGLEDQVRWATESGLMTARSLPDMLAIVDTGPLDAVAPERVTLIQ